MSRRLRLVNSGVRNARWNIAVTEALLELHRDQLIEDTLRLHLYERAVLLGRHQEMGRAINRQGCLARGVGIARRVTGGGAVYMSPGVLAWDLVTSRGEDLDPQKVSQAVGEALCSLLGSLGLSARFSPPGDVLVNGFKVSGTAGRHEADSLLHQGSLLVKADLKEMADCLRLENSDQGQPPVSTLSELAAVPLELSSLSRELAGAVAEKFGRKLVAGSLTVREEKLAEELLADEIGTEAFVLGSAMERTAG